MKKKRLENPTGLAREILKFLKEEPRQTPRSIRERLSFSRSTTMNALMVLSDLGLVETKVRGLYDITPLGKYVLEKIGKEGK